MKELLELNGFIKELLGGGIVVLLANTIRYIKKLINIKESEKKQREDERLATIALNERQEERLKQLEDFKTQQETLLDLIIGAEKASLHNQIWGKSEIYLERGYVTIGELNNIQYLFDSYRNLGGNGTGEVLYTKVSRLPVKDGGVLRKEDIH